MAINKWRWVRYEDDGVEGYECLKCRKTWSMRGSPGPFCSYCGTKWDGEVAWNTPEREERHCEIANAIYSKRPKSTVYWVVQVRVLWFDEKAGGFKPMAHEETDGWHDDEGTPWEAEKHSAKSMHAWLLQKRRFAKNDAFTRIEYRVIRRDAKDVKTVA